MKTINTPPAPEKKLSFVVHRSLRWKGARFHGGNEITVDATEVGETDFQAWIAHGWVSELKDGVALPPNPPARTPVAARADDPSKASPALGALPAREVPTVQVTPSFTNPRKDFNPEKMAGLVESVEKLGVMQPILVMPITYVPYLSNPGERVEKWMVVAQTGGGGQRLGTTHYNHRGPYPPSLQAAERLAAEKNAGQHGAPLYELVAGERRWRAATAAKLTTIPAIVRDLNAFEAAELQAVENLQREDLTPLEEATQYRTLLRLPGYGMSRLCSKLGKSESSVYGKMKLLELPGDARKALESGQLPQSTAELIARCEDGIQKKVAQAILHPPKYHLEEGTSVLSFRLAKQAVAQIEAGEVRRKRWVEAKQKAEGNGIKAVPDGELAKEQTHDGNPGYDSKYINGKTRCYEHTPSETWGKILGAKLGELPKYLGRDAEGNGHVWVLRKDAEAKAKEMDVKLAARGGGSTASNGASLAREAAERRRRKAEAEKQKVHLAEIVGAIERLGAARLPADFWRHLAATISGDCWAATSKQVIARRGLAAKGGRDGTLAKQAESMEGTQAVALLAEVILVGMRGGDYNNATFKKHLQRMRDVLGLKLSEDDEETASADVCGPGQDAREMEVAA